MSPNKISNSFLNQRSFKKFITVLSLLLIGVNGWGQVWSYDFGTGIGNPSGSFTSSTASLTYLPSTQTNGGTARVRAGNTGGAFSLTNPGLSTLGTASELQFTGNTGSTSPSRFSIYDYTAGKIGYVKFKIAFVGGTNGIYRFSIGDGANFSANNPMSTTEIFACIEWTMTSNSAITYKFLNGATASSTGLTNSTTLFTQTNSPTYSIEIYANNNISTSNYALNGNTYTLATNTWDLWVDGTKVGSNLAKSQLGNNVTFDSFSFGTQTNMITPGAVYIDDIEYSNSLPSLAPTITTTGTLATVNTTYGTASNSPTSFTVSGSNLTNDISISAPTGYEIAVGAGAYASSQTLTQTSGAVASTTINVRLAANTAAGSYSGNIALTSTGATSVNVATVSSTVSKKALTISGLTATNKNWDGTTSATVNGIDSEAYSGLVLSETFSIVTSGSISFVFSSANAGTAIPLTQTNTYSAPTTNYSITQPTLSANITAIAPSAPTITSITPGSGQLSVSFTAPTSTGGSTITNYEYSSNNGSTWTLRNPSSTSTPLLLNGLTNGTTYDVQIRAVNSIGSGTASAGMQGTPVSQATLTLSSNTFSSSFSTVYGTASSSQSFTLNGADLAGNITITPTTGFEISQTSGGTTGFATSQTITPSSGTISSTILYVRLAATASVGNYNTQNISASGGGATTQIIASSASGNIVSPKALTISGLSAANKVYDATTTVSITANPVYVGLANGESFSVSGNPTWAFTNKTVGTAKAITQTGLYSAPSSNYTLSQASLTADITLASLSISNLTVNTKSYDGTTTATLSGGTLVGLFSGDLVSISSSTGVFTTANVGTGISVTVNSVLTGTDASNYVLTQATGLTGTITIATQTLSFTTFTSPISASTTIVASSNCNGSITYTSSNTAVATINSSTGVVSVVGLGTTIITAASTATSNYSAATISQTLTVIAPSSSLLTFEFLNSSGLESTFNSNFNNSNISNSTISRGSGLINSGNTERFNATNWAVTSISNAITGNQYMEFTISPNTGFQFSVSSISFQIQRSSTGLSGVALRSSVNNYASNLDIEKSIVDNTSTQLITFNFSQNFSLNPITYRFYGYSEATGGSGGIGDFNGDDIIVTGVISCTTPLQSSSISGNSTVCGASNQNYSVTNIANTSYSWILPNGWSGTSSSNSINTIIGSNTGIETLTIKPYNSSAGCNNYYGTSSSLNVTVNPQPIVTSTSNSSICSGSSITLTGGGATSYSWNNNISDGVSFIPSSTTTYTVTGTNSYGCTNTSSTTVTVLLNTTSAASSSPTLCINTALTNITHSTTGATGIGTATGLPAGVTASWTNNTLTISGTPTVSGTFSYSIPLTGGCGTVNATGTITVNADKTVSAASSSPSLCMNTALTAITHNTIGATGIGTATGLPAGVTAAWVNNTLTISGTPTASGNFSYTIPLTGGCGSVNATGTITVLTSPTANAGADITGVTTCGKNTVTLNATALNNNETGTWTVVTLGTGATLPGSFTLSNTPNGDFSGSYGGTYTLAWTVINTTTNCSNTDNMVVTFNQPITSSLGSSIGNADFLWNGLTSVDWSTGGNWFRNVSGVYQLQTGTIEPTSTNQVFTLTAAQGGVCIGSNMPTIGNGDNALDVFVGSGITLNLASGSLNLNGNLVNNGTINAAQGTINFIGSTNATVSGSGTTTLNNVTINKSSGATLTLSTNVAVNGILNMTQGNVFTATSPNGLLTLGSSSAVPGTLSWTSGNIVGPFRRFFTTAATQGNEGLFPVGTATYQRYAKVNFTASPGTNQSLTAWYKAGAPMSAGAALYNGLPLTTQDGQLIQNYSADGYWQIDPTDNNYNAAINSANYSIELYANNLTGMQDPTICRIIKAAGSNTSSSNHVQWQGCGTHTTIPTGTSASAFVINSTVASGFSWFGVGTSNNQALPVELTSFSGNCAEGKVILDWATATEHNSAYFQVEYSRDGTAWQNIGVVAAAGNSVQNINYTLTHQQVANGNNYYRLRQVDIDGVEQLYDVIAVNCAAGSDQYIMTYPNPSEQNFQVALLDENLIGTATLSMVDARGMLIHSELLEVKAGTNLFLFNNTGLAPGIYYVKISKGAYSSEVVKQVVR